MNRAEMTPEQARMVLAHAVRQHLASPGTIFIPWAGFELCWHDMGEGDRVLYRVKDNTALLNGNAVYGMSDEEIERVVLGLFSSRL